MQVKHDAKVVKGLIWHRWVSRKRLRAQTCYGQVLYSRAMIQVDEARAVDIDSWVIASKESCRLGDLAVCGEEEILEQFWWDSLSFLV